MCFLTIIENYILNMNYLGTMPLYRRLSYFLNKKNNYIIQKNNYTFKLMNTHIIILLLVIISNIKFLKKHTSIKFENIYKFLF